MKGISRRWFLTAGIILVLLASVLPLTSCAQTQSGPLFYDAGATDLTLTSSQLTKYFLFRFDTSASGHILTLPNAADMVSTLSPAVGNFFVFGISADGANNVSVVGGANVTIKTSAKTAAANMTITVYCVFNNVTSGSQAVTIY